MTDQLENNVTDVGIMTDPNPPKLPANADPVGFGDHVKVRVRKRKPKESETTKESDNGPST